MTTITYKFRSGKEFQTIGFEGIVVNVLDFKKGVISQSNYNNENMARSFDFVIANQRTGEEYRNNNCLIPRNTFLVIHQVPATEQRAAKLFEPPTNRVVSLEKVQSIEAAAAQQAPPIGSPTGETAAKPVTGLAETVVTNPGPNYICHRCGVPGHWIRNCPTNSDKNFVPVIKRLQVGEFGRPTMRSEVPVENPSEKPCRIIVNGKVITEQELSKTRMVIPTTFRCDICRSILRVATVVPCCKKPFCKECIMQHIWRGGHCPMCLRSVTTDKLQVDQPLQERVNAFSEQLKRARRRPKRVMDEYVQRKGLSGSPRIHTQTPKFTSFRHNKKPTFIISCLNCNEKGHVFKDCPKLVLKDEPASVPDPSVVTSPSYIASPPAILPSPAQLSKSFSTAASSLDSSPGITLQKAQTSRYMLNSQREYRRSRKKRRRSSHTSSSRSYSRSRSRTSKKRRRRRSSRSSRSRSRRRQKFRRRKSSNSRSPAARDHSSSSHHKRRRDLSALNHRSNLRDWGDRLSSDRGCRTEEHNSSQGDWPIIRKPPPPNELTAHSPISAHSSSDLPLSLSPPLGWRKT